jgi:hypothetical protein
MSIQIGAGEAITLLLAGIATVVWLVRLEGKVKEAHAERKSDVEVINVKLGNIVQQQDRFERDISGRVRDLVRIVGRSKVFEDSDSE